ncbi:MAG TPA: ATP phosphoribosyltransferase regulatory subunit [Candidatus Cloacimonadota bacterium]|nr:ATP phosphoribosyltransferase regulatory subunit [Candidatus Cloacimonadota bacterium]
MVQDAQSFHEFMPEQVWKWKLLEQTIERILALYNYQEIRLSVLQDYRILHQGITALMQGTEAENAVERVLSICQPNDQLSLLSLRPEGTISVLHHTARIINPGEIHRFYYSGPMFRKAPLPQQMEYYQLGVELLGSDSVLSESEVISLGMKICHELNLKDVRLDLNSYGCFKCREKFFADLRQYLAEHKADYCIECFKELYTNPFSDTRCQDQKCLHSVQKGPQISDYLCSECKSNFNRLKKIQANLAHRYRVNPYLYKNFAYYNETVFDFVVPHKGQEIVIGGGGRYDYLSAKITGTSIPAVGFYLNLDSIFAIMEEGKQFHRNINDFSAYICAQSENLEMMTLQIAQELHSNGIKTILSPDISSTETELKRAKDQKCSLMLILREENIREGKIMLRNLAKDNHDYIALKDTIPAVILARKALIHD